MVHWVRAAAVALGAKSGLKTAAVEAAIAVDHVWWQWLKYTLHLHLHHFPPLVTVMKIALLFYTSHEFHDTLPKIWCSEQHKILISNLIFHLVQYIHKKNGLVESSESAAVKLLAKKLASVMQEENWDNWPSLSSSTNSDPPQGCSTHPGTPIMSSPTTVVHDVR